MTAINVWPRLGTTVTLESGYIITSVGAAVTPTKEILDFLRDRSLLTYDPTGENPNPSPIPGGGGGSGVPTYATAALLGATIGNVAGAVAITSGCNARGDGGGGTWYWDSSSSAVSDNAMVTGYQPTGRWFRLTDDGLVNVRWFGALGDGNQTLYSTSYVSDVAQTQQTHDGLAINAAIRYLRAVGGRGLYLPRGEYRVWGNLEAINFDCIVKGDGPGATIIKNCDTSPTNTNGYGIFRLSEPDYTGLADYQRVISIKDLTVHGAGLNRLPVQPQEFRNDLIYVGLLINLTIDNVQALESVRDNINFDFITPDTFAPVGYTYSGSLTNADFRRIAQTGGCRLSNSKFDNSFRNTVTIAHAWNVRFTNCDILRGGRVNGGTNPKSCLDIEPDTGFLPCRRILFDGCRFEDGVSNQIAVIGSEAMFTNCYIAWTPSGLGDGTPRIGVFYRSEVDMVDCKMVNKWTSGPDAYKGTLWCYPGFSSPTVGYSMTARVNIRGCSFEGGGLYVSGQNKVSIVGTSFRNSASPVYFEDTTSDSIFTIRDVQMTNVINTLSDRASLVMGGTTQARSIDIDGLHILFDPDQLPPGDVTAFQGAGGQCFGLEFTPATTTATSITLKNIHIGGFQKRFPDHWGFPQSTNFYDIRQIAVGGTLYSVPPPNSTTYTGGVAWCQNISVHGNNP